MMRGMLRYDSRDGGGPMHTSSSAKRTWSDSRSASEYTATVCTPSSRHARITRSAISPRFAINTFLNMAEDRGPPVGDEIRYGHHPVGSMRNSTWPYSTGCEFAATISRTTPSYSHSISFMIFIASMMQTICPFETRWPTDTYAGELGSGEE